MLEVLHRFAEGVALGLEVISVLIIAIGSLDATVRILGPRLTRRATHGALRRAWLGMARWLLLGLEFMLAADIVRTSIAPSWTEVGQLGAIAVIRTFLNYFLERDLEKAAEAPSEVASQPA
jgi:uncharacterized membrane protein